MYNCPNCSGNLSFDIASQKLMCDYCKTQLDPYEYEKTQDAEENDVFGVQVFTCPQCGGEIMTTNVTAAGFCTYCGASTILDSRMKQEKRPAHIIPFSRTKEDCQKAYASHVKRALLRCSRQGNSGIPSIWTDSAAYISPTGSISTRWMALFGWTALNHSGEATTGSRSTTD